MQTSDRYAHLLIYPSALCWRSCELRAASCHSCVTNWTTIVWRNYAIGISISISIGIGTGIDSVIGIGDVMRKLMLAFKRFISRDATVRRTGMREWE